jgi:hypothetical protein
MGFDDLLDADSDTVPDGCDLCPGGDDLIDTDSDMIADFCDAFPNYGSAFGISFDDAFADNGYGSDPATYYLSSHGITVWGIYFGVAVGDIGGWGMDGTDGPAFLGTDSPVFGIPSFDFDVDQGRVDLDIGIGGGSSDTYTVTAYLLGSLVDTDVISITDDLNGSGTWKTATVIGPLDEIRVTADSGFDFGIDNVVKLVPEPGTALSLLAGAGLLAMMARRRKR